MSSTKRMDRAVRGSVMLLALTWSATSAAQKFEATDAASDEAPSNTSPTSAASSSEDTTSPAEARTTAAPSPVNSPPVNSPPAVVGPRFGEVEESAPASVESLAARDREAVFRAFSAFASDQKRTRIIGAMGGMLVGGVTMGLGAGLADRANTSAEPWLIIGGVTVGLSALALIFPTPAENAAAAFHVDHPTHTDDQARSLENAWKDMAEDAARSRVIGSVVSMVLSAVAVGGGIAVLSGTGDMNESDRTTLGGLLVGSGAGIGIAGISQLFLHTPVENAYEQFEATRKTSDDVSWNLSVGASGLGVHAQGSF